MQKEYPNNIFFWLLNRAKRILKPYYLVIALVLILDIVLLKKNIDVGQILMLVLCVQDLCGDYFYKIIGLGHLWYITMLVMSYIVIAFCFVYRKKLKYWGGRIIGFLYVIQIIITLFVHPKVGRYLFYILVCVTAFYIAIRNGGNMRLRTKWMLTAIITGVVWSIRLGLYFRGSDANWYNNIYTYYSQVIMSAFIVYSFYCLENKGILRTNKFIKQLDEISYEVFLTHYMYIVGPLKVIGMFNNRLIENIAIIFLSLASGYILHIFLGCINRKVRIQ